MKIQQFIKKLNNTELGKGNTHEYYVLVPSNLDIEKIFDVNNRKPTFFDKITNKERNNLAQLSIGRETRIKGLGPYYRENKLCAGDEVVFERRDFEGEVKFYIDINHKQNIITFQKNTKGFEVLNLDRLKIKLIDNKYEIKSYFNNKLCEVIIQYKESEKKRTDSPDKTDFYDIIVDNKSILSEFKGNEYLELEEKINFNTLKKVVVWQTYEFQL
jgi:hypothetical protein